MTTPQRPLRSTWILAGLLLGACTTDPAATDSTTAETGAESAETTAETGSESSCTPDLESLRAEIFTPSCALAGCHTDVNPAGGLDFTVADLEAALVGAPAGTCDGWVRVVPQIPEDSLLYMKLVEPPCGALMPSPVGLPAAEVECVRGWIEGLLPAGCETCGGVPCIDLETDAAHCGACDNACPDGIACVAGECACPNGGQLCDGACVNVGSNPEHCGGCGIPCGADQVCSAGMCTAGCGDLTDCGGSCVDLDSDPDHCGECDNPCGVGNMCEAGSCGCPGDGVSFLAEVEPMLVDNCTNMGCHGFPNPAAGVDLRAGSVYANLVDVPSGQCANRMLVAPGEPGSSYLIDKLTGVNLCFGGQMPKAAPAFSAAQIGVISEWICRGALAD